MSQPQQLRAIRRAAWRAAARIRLGRALAALPAALGMALAAAAVALAARKVVPEHFSDVVARAVLLGAALLVLAALAHALLRRLPPHAGSLALDAHHDLRGRLTNAIELSQVERTAAPGGPQAALRRAAIEDAGRAAPRLSPRRAVPLRVPGELALCALLAGALAGLGWLEVPVERAVPRAPVVVKAEPLEMSPDDLGLFREALAELQGSPQSAPVEAAVARFNQLIEQIAARNISRAEAFRQMEAIERDLLQEAELEAQAIEEAVGETARELKKSELAEPVAKSLASKDLAGASKALRDLGARLRGKGGRPDAAELERLRQALARAAERKQEALRGLEERRAELRRQLLKKKPEPQDAGAPEEREQRLLRDKERELQRLDRQIEQQQRAARSLSKLDRDLAKAAEDLLRDLGMSADDLEQAAEDLSRMEQQEPSDQDKEALRQRLQELRELIRQQGQGGRQRMARMLRFGQRARGARGGEGGEEQELLRRSGRPGAQGQGELMLGRGSGAGSIPIPSGGGERSGERGGAQGSNEPGGKEAGTGTGGPIAGQATDPKMGTLDTQADGLDNKAGPTRAQVIYGAGDRGFRGRPYREVFKQYRTVAEDQVEREKIPDGYRFYVRRYFQLIRPRE